VDEVKRAPHQACAPKKLRSRQELAGLTRLPDGLAF
jgi:hypothetical protein